jgi:hypothetical protein
MSADNVLKAMEANGKPLTDEQQQVVADLLKEEAQDMKPEELDRIMGKLSNAYTSSIPRSADYETLRKKVKGLIDDLDKLPKSELDQTWFSAIYGSNQETLRDLTDTQGKLGRQLAGKANIFYRGEELALK